MSTPFSKALVNLLTDLYCGSQDEVAFVQKFLANLKPGLDLDDVRDHLEAELAAHRR
jgi:hypothetical protein